MSVYQHIHTFRAIICKILISKESDKLPLCASTKTLLQLCVNGIIPGTVTTLDEYVNYPGWQQGEFKSFHEFNQCSGLKYEYFTYNTVHSQDAVRITR